MGLSSNTLSEQELNDTALNFLRPRLITVPGIAVPFPYGGKSRQITVDLDTQKLLAQGLTPVDIVNAVGAQNLILPAGTQKIDATEYGVTLNGTPGSIAALNAIPVKTSNGATLYLGDVANVRDGFSPQTNVVRQDGQRGVLLSVLKNGGASTLDIVNNIYKLLPAAEAALPQDLKITPLFDQSLFVKAAIEGVIREALIAACLTAAMILLFLGNWRSTAIIAVSIPLSILCSLIVLHLIGQTINIMTLGGLALAVGILVDEATVEVENIHTQLLRFDNVARAVRQGNLETAVPRLLALAKTGKMIVGATGHSSFDHVGFFQKCQLAARAAFRMLDVTKLPFSVEAVAEVCRQREAREQPRDPLAARQHVVRAQEQRKRDREGGDDAHDARRLALQARLFDGQGRERGADAQLHPYVLGHAEQAEERDRAGTRRQHPSKFSVFRGERQPGLRRVDEEKLEKRKIGKAGNWEIGKRGRGGGET